MNFDSMSGAGDNYRQNGPTDDKKDSDKDESKNKYTMPGVLHYLQNEWARFEMERARHEMERAELQARISFLQGERKGQENMKMDLIRRIKMLELALKQERLRYYRATHDGADPPEDEGIPVDETDGEDTGGIPIGPSTQPGSNESWRQGRQLLRQYLTEIGYSETILDVRSFRVRSLLGMPPQQAGSESGSSAGKAGLEEQALRDAESAVTSLDFIQDQYRRNELNGDSDSDEDNGGMVALKSNKDKSAKNKKRVGMSADEENALGEFDFLESGEKKARGSKEDWQPDNNTVQRFINDYKEDAKRMMQQKHKSLTLSADAGGGVDAADDATGESEFHKMANKGQRMGVSPDTADIRDEFADDALAEEKTKKFNLRITLRQHMDAIRAMQFHPVEPVLCTAGEDGMMKLWDISGYEKGGAHLSDLEPFYTCRAHDGPVLSLRMSNTGDMAYTGGLDGNVRCWVLPSPAHTKPYEKYDPRVLCATLSGHTDAVWSVAVHASDNRLLSASADGTIRLWESGATSPLLQTYSPPTPTAVPTCVDFVTSESSQMVCAYYPGTAAIIDLETGKQVVSFDCVGDDGNSSRVTSIVPHPTMPVTVVGSEDQRIRYFDNNTGQLMHSDIAHVEPISCLAVDPNGLYLLSGAHDGSLRLWNMEKRLCLQEITAHRKKNDEGLLSVAFHPSRPLIASGGADSLAKVYA